MKTYEATEAAYKNGYKQGKADAMKWISVKERLPEKHEHILALTPNKIHGGYTTWLIWYDPKSGFYDSDPEWGDIEMDNVTHWMPLPQPPKGE